MTGRNTYLRQWSWGKSLLLKSGVLGMGIAAVLWADWPQSHNRHHDLLTPVVHQSTVTHSSPYSSTQAASTSTIAPLQLSGEGEAKSLQTVGTTFLVDLNLASRMELETLPGIGVILADRILSYRTLHGDFQQFDDLVKVSGIGRKRLQRLEPFVTIQPRVKERVS